MVQFIRCCTYKNIQQKLVLLYSLNISDILFTLVLLRTGLFREVNGVMAEVVGSTGISIMLKVIFIGILILILSKRMSKASEKQLRIANKIINVAVGVYCVINLMHISYVILYFIIR